MYFPFRSPARPKVWGSTSVVHAASNIRPPMQSGNLVPWLWIRSLAVNQFSHKPPAIVLSFSYRGTANSWTGKEERRVFPRAVLQVDGNHVLHLQCQTRHSRNAASRLNPTAQASSLTRHTPSRQVEQGQMLQKQTHPSFPRQSFPPLSAIKRRPTHQRQKSRHQLNITHTVSVDAAKGLVPLTVVVAVGDVGWSQLHIGLLSGGRWGCCMRRPPDLPLSPPHPPPHPPSFAPTPGRLINNW